MLIKAENISVARNKKEILKNINIVINQKDFITILGPNGAGFPARYSSLVKVIPP